MNRGLEPTKVYAKHEPATEELLRNYNSALLDFGSLTDKENHEERQLAQMMEAEAEQMRVLSEEEEEYLIHLVAMGEVNVKALIEQVAQEFSNKYGISFTGPERFWEWAFLLTEVGARIALKHGLIGFDYEPVIQKILEQVPTMRRSVTDNHIDAFGLVHEYVLERAHEVLTVMHTTDTGSAVDQNRLPRGEVRVRIDVTRKTPVDSWDRGTMMIVRRPFKEWLSSRGYDFGSWRKDIRGQQAEATPASGKFWMGKDTGLKFGQLGVIGLNLTHPDFHGYLQDPQLAPEDLTFGQLTTVK